MIDFIRQYVFGIPFPLDTLHIAVSIVAAVSTTLIIGKGKIFAPFRDILDKWVQTTLAKYTGIDFVHSIINCQQCLGFWVGLVFGAVLFLSPLWAFLMAVLVSLAAVWNDFFLLYLSNAAGKPAQNNNTLQAQQMTPEIAAARTEVAKWIQANSSLPRVAYIAKQKDNGQETTFQLPDGINTALWLKANPIWTTLVKKV